MSAAGSSSGGGGGGSSGRPANGAAAINAAANAVGSADARFHSQPPQQHRRNRWTGCFSGLSCFGSQKGGKRIVPAARIPEGNASTSRGNGHQSGGSSNQNVALNLSLLAPPSSPASFTNSALPSTVQSPSCFLSISANSPGGPSSNMFATGPYAHETQLVSPPVFSTYTTEPSTAPLTPPPELAHATTPSSPDVPYARFLSSSADLKNAGKEHSMPFLSSAYSTGSGLQASYPLYPGSPSSSLISPASATPRTGLSSPIPEQEVPTARWNTSRSARDSPYSRNASSNIFGLDSVSSRNFMLDSSFFRPAASAQFHLDQAQQSFPYNGGRLSVSRESDVYTSGGNRHNVNCKQDVEETEAYRASFGFSADEIITTQHYVEVSDGLDESFTISPFGNSNLCAEQCSFTELPTENQKAEKPLFDLKVNTSPKKVVDQLANGSPHKVLHCNIPTGPKSGFLLVDSDISKDGHPFRKARDETSLKTFDTKKKFQPGQSCSDAEIEYRRAKSLRETNGILAWRTSLP